MNTPMENNQSMTTTRIAINNQLVEKAMELSGLNSKKEVAEKAFNLLIQMISQAAIRDLRGKLRWEGNLEQMRLDSFIGTFCIENNFPLLQNDKDFEPMKKYLGLRLK